MMNQIEIEVIKLIKEHPNGTIITQKDLTSRAMVSTVAPIIKRDLGNKRKGVVGKTIITFLKNEVYFTRICEGKTQDWYKINDIEKLLRLLEECIA